MEEDHGSLLRVSVSTAAAGGGGEVHAESLASWPDTT